MIEKFETDLINFCDKWGLKLLENDNDGIIIVGSDVVTYVFSRDIHPPRHIL